MSKKLSYGLNITSHETDEQEMPAPQTNTNESLRAPPPPSNGDGDQQPSSAPLPSKYEVPFWSPEEPLHPYRLSVNRLGTELPPVPLTGGGHFYIGRLPTCYISLEHPSVSREHAVIQHRGNGSVYMFDLGSTHGTFVNKTRVKPHCYVEIRNGDFIRFGESNRRYILEGGPSAEQLSAARQEASVNATAPASATATHEVPNATERFGARRAGGRFDRQTEEVGNGGGGGGGDDEHDDGEGGGKTPVFTGNVEEFRAFLREQKGGGKKRGGISKTALLRETGFEKSDVHKQRPSFVDPRLEVNMNRGTFGARDTKQFRGDDDDEDSDDLDKSGGDDESEEEGSAGSDAGAAMRRNNDGIGANDEFDSDDDFFDRTKSKTSEEKKKKSAKSSKSKRSRAGADDALDYRGARVRIEALDMERARIADDLHWFNANVFSGGDARAEVDLAMAEDELDAYLTATKTEMKREKQKELKTLLQRCDAELKRTRELAEAVRPPSILGDFDHEEVDVAAAYQDPVGVELARELDEIALVIERPARRKRDAFWAAMLHARQRVKQRKGEVQHDGMSADDLAREEHARMEAAAQRREQELLDRAHADAEQAAVDARRKEVEEHTTPAEKAAAAADLDMKRETMGPVPLALRSLSSIPAGLSSVKASDVYETEAAAAAIARARAKAHRVVEEKTKAAAAAAVEEKAAMAGGTHHERAAPAPKSEPAAKRRRLQGPTRDELFSAAAAPAPKAKATAAQEEKDAFVEGGTADEWVPPSNSSKLDELKKKLGY